MSHKDLENDGHAGFALGLAIFSRGLVRENLNFFEPSVAAVTGIHADELEERAALPEECSKLIELMCRLMAENEKEGEKEIVKETLTIGDWEGQLIWLCGELADENPDDFDNPLDERSVGRREPRRN